jgi:hypothetical protein
MDNEFSGVLSLIIVPLNRIVNSGSLLTLLELTRQGGIENVLRG